VGGEVLIVDDDPAVRVSLRGLLERRGLSPVGAASDGNEAVAMATSLEPDAIVMDRMMPAWTASRRPVASSRCCPTRR
jgi:two-component system, response regulator PdtaR